MANWLPEDQAAKKIDRAPRTLRRYVKKGTWNVAYKTLNGRSFHYNERDLERLFTERKSA
jgi:hypothetical protein